MKNSLITIAKIIAGIFAILIPIVLVAFIVENIVIIHDYHMLKWIALFISAVGFYISGLINRNTPLKWIPLLYISLLVFIPLRYVYFPLFYFIILFATLSLFVTRKEFARKYRLISIGCMTVLFTYFLFSQPLVIRKTKEITYHNDVLQNVVVLWDFSKEMDNRFPEYIYLDTNNNRVDLRDFNNKTLYISFWATWCGPCMQEKPELEALKTHFKENTDIVFIDILLDDSEARWLNYIEHHKPQGFQVRSRNSAKTRELLEISGIPVHIIVNSKGLYRKERFIERAYDILSNTTQANLNRDSSLR